MLRIVVATLWIAGSAYAEAPGETPPWAPPSGRDVMADRWAVGLSVGSLGLHPDGGASTSYSVGELSLRFCATPHHELEAAFGAGPTAGDATEVEVGTLGLRYRFRPRADWNGWLMGAIGGLTVAAPGASAIAASGASRGVAELGAGLERRFGHLALQAELRAIAAGSSKADDDAMARSAAPTAPDTLSGGSLTLGASYYF